MNYITIREPRWSTRDILIADYKIGATNQIVIEYKELYPEPFYMTEDKLKSYPMQTIKSKQGKDIMMRVVPLVELSTDLVLGAL